MTQPRADHLHTQPLSPAVFSPAPLGAIPSQRGSGQAPFEAPAPGVTAPAVSEPYDVSEPSGPASSKAEAPKPGLSAPDSSKAVRPKTNNRMFVGAAVLTGCALLSSIWGTVVTSQAAAAEPAKTPSSAAASGTTQGVIDSAPPVLAPGEIAGEGVYGVGSDLQPGTYRTAGPTPAAFDNCYWERSSDTSGRQKAVIANGIVTGPFTVTIKRTDRAFKTSGCENWTKVQ